MYILCTLSPVFSIRVLRSPRLGVQIWIKTKLTKCIGISGRGKSHKPHSDARFYANFKSFELLANILCARKQIFHEISQKQCSTSNTWGRLTHICVHRIKQTITGEDNGVTPVRCEAIIRTKDCLLSIEQTSVRFAPKYDGLHSKWSYIVCTVATPLGLDVFRKTNIDIISNFHYRYIHTYIWIISISVWHLLLNNVEGAQGNSISYDLSGTMFWFNSIRPRDICVSKLGHRRGDGGLICALKWCHNGHDSVSNYQPHDCLLDRLFRFRSKKTSNLRATGLCAGTSPGSGEFHVQMASNAENTSIWWRNHGSRVDVIKLDIRE